MPIPKPKPMIRQNGIPAKPAAKPVAKPAGKPAVKTQAPLPEDKAKVIGKEVHSWGLDVKRQFGLTNDDCPVETTGLHCMGVKLSAAERELLVRAIRAFMLKAGYEVPSDR